MTFARRLPMLISPPAREDFIVTENAAVGPQSINSGNSGSKVMA
jgi:hypothetical protein